MPLRLARTFASSYGHVRWDRLGDGPPVVLVHGTPFSSVVWQDLARGLAASHEVYLWDLLGFGQSEQGSGQDVSLAAQTRVLAELVGHWGLEEPAVVAHDVGGAIVLRAHLLERLRFRRLVLADVVAMAPWGTGFFRLVQQHPAAFHASAGIRGRVGRARRMAARRAGPSPRRGTAPQRAAHDPRRRPPRPVRRPGDARRGGRGVPGPMTRSRPLLAATDPAGGQRHGG